jgi:hypothetical protein
MLALLLALPAADPEPAPPPVKILARATWADMRWPPWTTRAAVIRDAKALAGLAGRPEKGDGPAKAEEELAKALGVKAISWRTQMVLAVILERRERKGDRVEIRGVKVTEGILTVSWRYTIALNPKLSPGEHPTAVILVRRFTGKIVFDPPLE